MNDARDGALRPQRRTYPSFLPACAVLVLLGILFILASAFVQGEGDGLKQGKSGQVGLVDRV